MSQFRLIAVLILLASSGCAQTGRTLTAPQGAEGLQLAQQKIRQPARHRRDIGVLARRRGTRIVRVLRRLRVVGDVTVN